MSMVGPPAVTYDLSPEASALGALLSLGNAETQRAMLDVLSPEDFTNPDHRTILRAIRRMSGPIDAATVRAELERSGELARLVGRDLILADLMVQCPVPANGLAYARQVAADSHARQVAAKAGAVADLAGRGAAFDEPLRELAAMARPAGTAARTVEVLEVAELERTVNEAGPPSWLVDGLWPADAYGVLGAEDKAGKSWAFLDLAVSVVTGTPWLGTFPCPYPGEATIYLGEGGGRQAVRRLAAIIADRGGELGDLSGLRIGLAVPRLLNPADVEQARRELTEHPARLVGIDPLYLAAAGAKGSDLYAMGEALGGLQQVAQEASAALVLTTHWNKNGSGDGPERFTGVGPGAWGRVLGSAAVERRIVRPDGSTDVQLRWSFRGSEIADRVFRMRRTVWATDPADLSSPLSYHVEVTEERDPGGELSRSQARVLDALKGAAPAMIGVKAIGDAVAEDGQGKPLRVRTIQDALATLERLGMLGGTEPGSGLPRLWGTA